MQIDDVILRLNETPLPDSSAARRQTETSAAELVAPRRPRSRRWRNTLLAIAAGALLLISPPGQSIAEELGHLVGIGDPATRTPPSFGEMIERGQPIVLASGEAPGGAPFEIVVSRALFPERATNAPGDAGGEETCLTVDFPGVRLGTGEVCGDRDRPNDVVGGLEGANYSDAADRLAPEARYVFTAELSPQVSRAELTYENEHGETVEAPVTMGTMTDELRDAVGTKARLAYMVGFVPDDGKEPYAHRTESGVLGTVKLAGYDQAGDEVDSYDFGAHFDELMAEKRANIAASKEHAGEGVLARDEEIAFAALCPRAGESDSGFCKEALAAAADDPTIAAAAEELDPLIVREGDVVTLKTPEGDNYAMDIVR